MHTVCEMASCGSANRAHLFKQDSVYPPIKALFRLPPVTSEAVKLFLNTHTYIHAQQMRRKTVFLPSLPFKETVSQWSVLPNPNRSYPKFSTVTWEMHSTNKWPLVRQARCSNQRTDLDGHILYILTVLHTVDEGLCGQSVLQSVIID